MKMLPRIPVLVLVSMFSTSVWGADLYGVTGDGATTPETLYRIDKTNGAMTFVLALGNGANGEAIGFRPQDGYLYHASGSAVLDRFWEAIDTSVPSVVASGPVTGAPDEGSES